MAQTGLAGLALASRHFATLVWISGTAPFHETSQMGVGALAIAGLARYRARCTKRIGFRPVIGGFRSTQ